MVPFLAANPTCSTCKFLKMMSSHQNFFIFQVILAISNKYMQLVENKLN